MKNCYLNAHLLPVGVASTREIEGDLGFPPCNIGFNPKPSPPSDVAYPALPLLAWPKLPSRVPRLGLPIGIGTGIGCIKELFGLLLDEVLEELEAVLFARRWRLILSGSMSAIFARRAKTERTERQVSHVRQIVSQVQSIPTIHHRDDTTQVSREGSGRSRRHERLVRDEHTVGVGCQVRRLSLRVPLDNLNCTYWLRASGQCNLRSYLQGR